MITDHLSCFQIFNILNNTAMNNVTYIPLNNIPGNVTDTNSQKWLSLSDIDKLSSRGRSVYSPLLPLDNALGLFFPLPNQHCFLIRVSEVDCSVSVLDPLSTGQECDPAM